MTIRVPSITYDGEEYLLGDEYTAGSGINITSNQISNTGVTSFNGNTGAVTYTAPAETVVSGDSGTTYTVKVANSDPTSGTPATTITFVV